MGGCASKLKACPPCKELLAAHHRGKIGSISDSSAPTDEKATDPPPPQLTHRYIKNDASRHSSKLKRSPTGHFQDSAGSEVTPYSTCPIYIKRQDIMGLKLYSVSDSPPTLAVRMALKYLDIEYELINIDFAAGEHLTPEYLEKNPQGEVPLLVDNDFTLNESVAILQYLGDKYKKDETFYPADPKERALVNQRLAFHLTTLYRSILDYMLLPLFYAYPRTEENLKKLVRSLKVFEEYLKRGGSQYVVGENVTIADLPLVMDLVCLEAIAEFEETLSAFPMIKGWYEGFKVKCPDLWAVAVQGLEELKGFEQNPPDLSHLQHPIHPTDKSKLK